MDTLEERVITAWVKLTGVLKNTRITQGMIYNEAIVMNLVYEKYREDGVGLTSFKEIVRRTQMLKSLVNRTIESLVKKGYLERIDGKDKRTTYVKAANLDDFLEEHDKTLALVRGIIETIGAEDAEAFVRLSDKVAASDPLNNSSES